MAPVPTSSTITLSICNRTDIHFSVHSTHIESEKAKLYVPLPATSLQSNIPCQPSSDRSLSIRLLDDKTASNEIIVNIPNYSVSSQKLAKWKHVDGISLSKQAQILFRCTTSSTVQILLFTTHDPATFLSWIGDEVPLTSLCLPGTHESLALYGWPISTCQSESSSVEKQLSDGIRYLDVRLAPKGQIGKERLLAYHGITDERIEFGSVLKQCYDFLDTVGKNGEKLHT